MAAGDIKSDNAEIVYVTAGTAVTKGQVVHLETDGKWDPIVHNDIGPFGVAIEAATGDTVEFAMVKSGRVEVEYAGTADASIGEQLMASTQDGTATTDGDAGTVTAMDNLDQSGNSRYIVGNAMELCDTSGNTYTIELGGWSGN